MDEIVDEVVDEERRNEVDEVVDEERNSYGVTHPV
jgi:hypothetical protein